ncbi:hypothetical protein AK812_SmicGene3623 [Symbiodinium microadriaticum]|uniref:E3 ubiquitin-protein ligase HERC2 n=1 Tax=Symbiodinium microadriaticum TaxID=2951 RepID=A0A1Q9EY99_SYMMI|nr:hypothetical protein AK812_SmicGene3623 [Symbiodinium microadriaticum]
MLRDGSVVTWGLAFVGGDCSAVRDQLKNVKQIQATREAFAAILGDGSVVTWGEAHFGGDCSDVLDEPLNVQQIQAAVGAFAAILGDGSVVTWGHAFFGGDSSAVRDELQNAQQIQATERSFAAILGNGSVVTWGDAGYGGDCCAVRDQLKNVQQIQATQRAFAAILGDGSVVTWGDAGCGGDCCAVRDQLKNVQQIQATWGAFAAMLGDGCVVTWGSGTGGDSSVVRARHCVDRAENTLSFELDETGPRLVLHEAQFEFFMSATEEDVRKLGKNLMLSRENVIGARQIQETVPLTFDEIIQQLKDSDHACLRASPLVPKCIIDYAADRALRRATCWLQPVLGARWGQLRQSNAEMSDEAATRAVVPSTFCAA